jgi:NADPH:quinone reductase-like Zn-dependent oxidoreductase
MLPWMRRAVEYAASKGVYLCMENHGGGISGSPGNCRRLAGEVGSPHFGVLYDPCNLLTNGADYREGLEVMKDHIVHVHVKDGTKEHGSQKKTMLGEGEVDVAWILRRLDETGYRGDITLEYEVETVPAEEGLRRWYEYMAALDYAGSTGPAKRAAPRPPAGAEKLVMFTAREKAELVERPADAKPLAANELRGRTLVSLVSPGTEIGGSYLGKKFPTETGYAAVFEVEEAGAEVKDVKPGDAVFCTGPAGIGGHRSVQRCPREAAIPVPPGLDPAAAVHARLMGVSWSTLTTTVARPPDKVLVLGLGPVGHLAAQVFRGAGYRVMAVEPVDWRRELARSKGIADVRAAVPLDDRAAMDGIALALECSAREEAALAACKSVKKRGEVVLIGVPRERRSDLHAFDLLEAVFKRYVTLRSGWEWEVSRHPADFRTGSVFGNLQGAVAWLAEGRVDVTGLYETMIPSRCQETYQGLMKGDLRTLSVVFDWAGCPSSQYGNGQPPS